MAKVGVVYWSGTGNTEKMAEAIADGVRKSGGEATLFRASEFSPSHFREFDTVAFGCPSMGVEELEEEEFVPMFDRCLPNLKKKRIALFGSYGWGDGEWMRNWVTTCENAGANLVSDYVICNEAPDDEAIKACKKLGSALV